MNITKSHAAHALRHAGKLNPWTLPIEPQFNAAALMLFRARGFRLVFPFPRMANAIPSVPFRRQNGTFPCDCSETRG
jgi:hypothetical protein